MSRPRTPAHELIPWLRAGGVELGPVHLEHHPSRGFGFVARASLSKDEDVMVVPPWMILGAPRGALTPVGRRLEQTGGSLGSMALLSVAVLHELDDPHSLLGPWVAHLPGPEALSRYPAAWSEAERALLDGTSLLFFVLEQRRELRREHELLCAASPEWAASVPWPRWLWARLVTGSRAFGIHMGQRSHTVLVPGADDFNHAPEPSLSWGWDDRIASFHVWAVREVEAGEALTISYGKLPNGRELTHYGFHGEAGRWHAGQPGDSLYLPLPLPEADHELARRFLPAGPLDAVWLVPDYDHLATRRGLAILRVMLATPGERAFLGRLSGDPAHPLPPISPRNEAACLRWLADHARTHLQQLGRTPPGDSPQHRAAEVVRAGERATCEQLIALEALVAPLWGQDAGACRRAMASTSDELARTYLEAVVLPMLPEGA